MEGTGVTANSLHPGVIYTELWRHTGSIFQTAIKFVCQLFTKNVPQGAATQVYLAIRPEVEGVGGKYFADCQESTPIEVARNAETAKKLWELSEKLVGLSS